MNNQNILNLVKPLLWSFQKSSIETFFIGRTIFEHPVYYNDHPVYYLLFGYAGLNIKHPILKEK